MAVLVIGGISWLALSQARLRPWLGVGWCWYLGTLVPVLGLVQVGHKPPPIVIPMFHSLGYSSRWFREVPICWPAGRGGGRWRRSCR